MLSDSDSCLAVLLVCVVAKDTKAGTADLRYTGGTTQPKQRKTTMPNADLDTLTYLLSRLRLAFNRRSFEKMLILFAGWVLTDDPTRYVTSALVATGASSVRPWVIFHRFFSRAKWKTDTLGWMLFLLLRRLLGDSRWVIAADDSVCRKKGDSLFGVSYHVDPVSSSRGHKNIVPGHCWVTLSVTMSVPWSCRPWAVPVLFRLFVGKKHAGANYKKKTALLVEMLEEFSGWVPEGIVCDLVVDSAYVCNAVARAARQRFTLIGAVKSNSRFNAPKPELQPNGRGGRPKKKGERLPVVSELLQSRKHVTIKYKGYSKTRMQKFCVMQVQWYSVLGESTCTMLCTKSNGMVRVFVCSDPSRSAREILETYARRWSQECWYRDAKQYFGWADSPASSEQAVLHMAPWVGLMSGLMTVWFHSAWQQAVTLPIRPWYTHKKNLSFEDMLRACRATLRGVDILEWAASTAKNTTLYSMPTTGVKKAPVPRCCEIFEGSASTTKISRIAA